MSEELKPVETDLNAGEVKPAEDAKAETEQQPEVDKPGLDETVIADALAVIKESDNALAAAEKRIIRDKRKAKGGEEVVDDFEERVAEAGARQLEARNVQPETDKELERIAASRAELMVKQKKLLEISEALKAKHSLSTSSGGSNQDKLKPAKDLSKNLGGEEKALYQDIADRRGLSLDTVLKLKAEAEIAGEDLIFYMKKKK